VSVPSSELDPRSPASECVSPFPTWTQRAKGGEEQHVLAGEGGTQFGNSDGWKESLALCAYERHLPHGPHHLLDVTNETEGVARNGVLPSLAGADGGIMRDLYGDGTVPKRIPGMKTKKDNNNFFGADLINIKYGQILCCMIFPPFVTLRYLLNSAALLHYQSKVIKAF
jgi:hypothetical protein